MISGCGGGGARPKGGREWGVARRDTAGTGGCPGTGGRGSVLRDLPAGTPWPLLAAAPGPVGGGRGVAAGPGPGPAPATARFARGAEGRNSAC